MLPKRAGRRFSPMLEQCGCCAMCSTVWAFSWTVQQWEVISTTEPPKARRERGTGRGRWHRTATLIPWLIPDESQGYSLKSIRKKSSKNTEGDWDVKAYCKCIWAVKLTLGCISWVIKADSLHQPLKFLPHLLPIVLIPIYLPVFSIMLSITQTPIWSLQTP